MDRQRFWRPCIARKSFRDGMRRPAPGGMRYAPNGYALEVQKETGHEEEYHCST
jgi:hypothetical protein